MARVIQILLATSSVVSVTFLMNLGAYAGAPGVTILYDDLVNGYYPNQHVALSSTGVAVHDTALAGGSDASTSGGAGSTSGSAGPTSGSAGSTSGDTSSGHDNNGHGNNVDGVDSSNPSQGIGGPNGAVDPSGSVDDESHGGGSSSSSSHSTGKTN